MTRTTTLKRSRAPAKAGRIGDSAPKTTAAKTGNARAGLPLRWRATEYAPRKRWWWFVGVAVAVLWIADLCFLAGNWAGSLVALLAGVAIFRWYLPKPRSFDFELDGTTLRIDDGKLSRDLSTYRSFFVEAIPQRSGQDPFELIVLIPKKTFGLGFDVYLPDDPEEAKKVVDGFAEQVTLDGGRSGPGPWAVLNRLVRALRLG